MVCVAPRARKDSVRPRRVSGVVVRPLDFAVRRQAQCDSIPQTVRRLQAPPLLGRCSGCCLPSLSPLYILNTAAAWNRSTVALQASSGRRC